MIVNIQVQKQILYQFNLFLKLKNKLILNIRNV